MTVKIPGYEILRPIAEGGMASVYLAVQESLGRQVALKLLRKFDNPGQATRFHNEGHIIASLNHRNIITIYDIGICEEQHYISMAYLEGGDLEQRIQAGMGIEAILDLLEVMGSCLDFLHRKEIIHRDIKPANILFHKDGTPILTDFGVARQLEGDMRLTMEGSAVGSPHYLSPEQAECRPLDGRTDLYGLGIVFYEMLTGMKPYEGSSHIETILAHLTMPLPELPPAMDRYQGLLDRMIAKDPDERFATAGEMLEYLQGIRQNEPRAKAAGGLLARLRGLSRSGKTARIPRGTGRRRMAVIAVTACIATAVLVIGLSSLKPVQPANEATSPVTMQAAATPAPEVPAIPSEKTGTMTRGDTESPGNPSRVSAAPAVPAADNRETQREKSPPRVSARPVRDAPPSQHDKWLRRASKAMDDYRLTTPPRDNAYYYYRRILEEDPLNAQAQAGMARIAKTYVSLAEQELKRFYYGKARTYINRGLAIDPDNRRLRELQRTNALTDASRRAIGKVKSIFR